MRLAVSLLVALLSPVVAWAVWVLPFDGYPPDAWSVAWFATVAVGAVLAGWCTPAGRRPWKAVSAAAVVAALAVLWTWWSSTDETGLFVVGILIALPPLVVGGPALVAAGRGLRGACRRAGAAPGR